MTYSVDASAFGAVYDGQTDCSAALAQALASGATEVTVTGACAIAQTLQLVSGAALAIVAVVVIVVAILALVH